MENVQPPYRSTYGHCEDETQEFHFSDTNNSTPFPHTSLLSSPSPSTRSTSVLTQETHHPPDVDRNPRPPATALDPIRVGSDAAEEVSGFGHTGLPPEVQHAMRLLVRKILLSTFFVDKTFEPSLGTLEASALMADVSSDIWTGYGMKGKSIYSLFIRVDGDDCECLWCGDVQHGKLLRAIGHFRAKHLGHKPFACDLQHADEKVW